MKRKFQNREVASVFAKYPVKHRENMELIRSVIFDVAESIDGVGQIEETLKWGEPAYLTSQSSSGTTIRIDWKSKQPDFYGVYFHCQTNLVQRFRDEYSNDFEFDANRCIKMPVDEPLPIDSLAKCFAAALTYHCSGKK